MVSSELQVRASNIGMRRALTEHSVNSARKENNWKVCIDFGNYRPPGMPRAFLIRSRSALPTQNSKKETFPDVQDENTDRNAQPTGISEHFKRGKLYLLFIIFMNFRKESSHFSSIFSFNPDIHLDKLFVELWTALGRDFHVEICLKFLLIKFTQTTHNFC